jgi:hypothetical protein
MKIRWRDNIPGFDISKKGKKKDKVASKGSQRLAQSKKLRRSSLEQSHATQPSLEATNLISL